MYGIMPRPQRFCIFCDGHGLTRTHIWPDWLERLILPGSHRLEELDNPHVPSIRGSRIKQGSLFSQKPRLCCEICNGGWMMKFEDEMTAFAKPLFTSLETVTTINETQRRILAVWVSLITILAEFIDRTQGSICIPKSDRAFLKKYLMPPETWTIVACSLNAKSWHAKYRHHASFIGQFSSVAEYYDAVARGRTNNTQISSFGMGHLFVQVFSCPNYRFIDDFRVAFKSRGFVQLWPIPSTFWPFSNRAAKFPTKTVLNDNEAPVIADAFNDRIKFMAQPPHFGGQIIR
jgi:hypothetical protein